MGTVDKADEARREGEIQDLLDRPRVMEEGRSEAQVLRRRHSSFEHDDDGTVATENGSTGPGEVMVRYSLEIQELLRRGFGSPRASHEVLR